MATQIEVWATTIPGVNMVTQTCDCGHPNEAQVGFEPITCGRCRQILQPACPICDYPTTGPCVWCD